MKRFGLKPIVGVTAVAALLLLPSPATGNDANGPIFHTRLSSLNEVPSIVAGGEGNAVVRLLPGREIRYRVRYETEGEVLQAHIHIGQRGVNGGVSAFLCSNLGTGPAATPMCPPSPGVVEGVITASEVIGPGTQGIEAGELRKLMAAIRAGAAYVNVHTDKFPSGELRGQLGRVNRRR